jgi:hypothetical protein
MSSCPSCNAPTAAAQSFCRTCGKSLASASSGDKTVNLARTRSVPPSVGLNKPVPLDDLFGTKRRLIVGRDPTCDVVLASRAATPCWNCSPTAACAFAI